MSRRLDLLRSGLQSVASRAVEFAQSDAVQRVRGHVKDLLERRLVVPADVIRKELLRVDGVESLFVQIQEQGVYVEASFTDGEPWSAHLHVERAFFAPRGGKELFIRCTPSEATRHRYAGDIAGALASAIMRVVWAPLIAAGASDQAGGFAERDAEGVFRVDARSLAFVRPILRAPATAMFMETRGVQGVHVRGDALVAELSNPFSGM